MRYKKIYIYSVYQGPLQFDCLFTDKRSWRKAYFAAASVSNDSGLLFSIGEAYLRLCIEIDSEARGFLRDPGADSR